MSNLEDKVKKEIEKTGLTTEIKASTILKDSGWWVYNEYPYLDIEENKIRLLDIKAIKKIKTSEKSDDSSTIRPSCELYIECKKSTKQSWVFYTEISPYPYLDLSLKKMVSGFVEAFKVFIESDKQKQKAPIDIFSNIPIRFEKLKYRIALSHKIIFGGKDDFYNAQMQILKALHHEASLRQSTEKMTIIPMIIFDGNLFEYSYVLKEFRITKTDYTRYLSYGLPSQKMPVFIDVVSLEYLPKYIELIEREFNLSNSD